MYSLLSIGVVQLWTALIALATRIDNGKINESLPNIFISRCDCWS